MNRREADQVKRRAVLDGWDCTGERVYYNDRGTRVSHEVSLVDPRTGVQIIIGSLKDYQYRMAETSLRPIFEK